jgi:hypothetical protein
MRIGKNHEQEDNVTTEVATVGTETARTRRLPTAIIAEVLAVRRRHRTTMIPTTMTNTNDRPGVIIIMAKLLLVLLKNNNNQGDLLRRGR